MEMGTKNRNTTFNLKISENWLVYAALFGLSGIFLALISKLNVVDIDLFHEMALAREIIGNGYFPKKDIFSYIPTIEPVVHHEWGTGVVLYLTTVASSLGAGGLLILKYLLTVSIMLGCYFFICKEREDKLIFPWIAIIGIIMVFYGFTTIRAQLFSLFFMVLLFHFLEKDRQEKKWWIFAWLPLYLLWLNMHAGFLVGLGLLGLYIVERFLQEIFSQSNFSTALLKIKHLLVLIVVMILLIGVNPYGVDYVFYLIRAILLDRSELVIEWRPLWQIPVRWFILPLYILSLILVLYSFKQKKISELRGILFICLTAWLALWHFRYLFIYALIWSCYLPAYIKNTNLAARILHIAKNRREVLFLLWVVLGIGGTVSAFSNQFWHLQIPTTEETGKLIYPAGAVAFLTEQQFYGNLMLPLEVGGFVSWKMYPKVKVSVDSRFEVAYHYDSVQENVDFYRAKDGWQATLTRYQTDAILVPRWSPVDTLIKQPGVGSQSGNPLQWQPVYKDDSYSLFIKSGLADKFPFTDKTGQPIPATFP
jgi:hypothetical protein